MSSLKMESEKDVTREITYKEKTTIEPLKTEETYTKRANVSSSIGGAILLYIILFVLSWVVLFTFNPQMVQTRNFTGTGTPPPDSSRCFISSLIISLVICIIIWLFMRSC